MCIFRSLGAIALWGSLLIIQFLVTGCSGIEPYQPYDYREEGLKKGLFTGSEGEFVILRKVDEPETGSKTNKKPGNAAIEQ